MTPNMNVQASPYAQNQQYGQNTGPIQPGFGGMTSPTGNGPVTPQPGAWGAGAGAPSPQFGAPPPGSLRAPVRMAGGPAMMQQPQQPGQMQQGGQPHPWSMNPAMLDRIRRMRALQGGGQFGGGGGYGVGRMTDAHPMYSF